MKKQRIRSKRRRIKILRRKLLLAVKEAIVGAAVGAIETAIKLKLVIKAVIKYIKSDRDGVDAFLGMLIGMIVFGTIVVIYMWQDYIKALLF